MAKLCHVCGDMEASAICVRCQKPVCAFHESVCSHCGRVMCTACTGMNPYCGDPDGEKCELNDE